VSAAATVTFARRKPAHLLMPGRALCGAVTLVDIGIPDSVIAGLPPSIFVDEPALWRGSFPQPGPEAHKYRRGHVLVASGPSGRSGAARLSARGALRAGAGLVTIASPRDALAENAAHLTAIMLQPCDGAGDIAAILSDRRWTAAVLGPGLGVGEATRGLVAAAASSQAKPGLVLDADVLTSFAGETGVLRDILAPLEGRCVLTPHEGEFARLMGADDGADHRRSKVDRARRAADGTGAVVVLKGPDTVVAEPGGRAAINETATPYLATAGSGDVLAGIAGGLMGQGMPPFEAAAAAVWLHGASALRFGPGLIAEDLPELLPQVLRDLVNGSV
jgi:NAD(P)H-hydrate epimerase